MDRKTIESRTEKQVKRILGIKIKKLHIVIIYAVAAVIGVTYTGLKLKEAHEERLEAEAMTKEEQRIAEEIVLPIAEALGINDLVFEYMEPGSLDATCCFSSETYGSLSDEEKLISR